MKRFTFSLQYLANLHAARQQQAEQALSAALNKLAESEGEQRVVLARRSRIVEEIEVLKGRMKRTEWSEKVRYMQEFDRQLAQCRQAILVAKKGARDCRDRLNEELKECRILEKIEKSERTHWRESVCREEQKQMDELAAGRWVRQEVME